MTFSHVERIRSDLGTEYVNKVLRDLTLLLDIQHDKSTAYHHESLGTVERSHKTLNEYVRSYIKENKDWPNLLKYFAYCYNTTPNSSIDYYTPFELVFGRMPTRFNEVRKGEALAVNEYVTKLQENLEIAYRKTNEFIRKNKQNVKLNYDKKAIPLIISVGDKVLLINEIRTKWDPLYKNEFVVEEVQEENVVIKNLFSNKTSLVHKNRLRRY